MAAAAAAAAAATTQDYVAFDTMDDEELRSLAAVQVVEWRRFYDEATRQPLRGGLLDTAMGAHGDWPCSERGCEGGECPGHFGYVELCRPVFTTRAQLACAYKLLGSHCVYCGELLVWGTRRIAALRDAAACSTLEAALSALRKAARRVCEPPDNAMSAQRGTALQSWCGRAQPHLHLAAAAGSDSGGSEAESAWFPLQAAAAEGSDAPPRLAVTAARARVGLAPLLRRIAGGRAPVVRALWRGDECAAAAFVRSLARCTVPVSPVAQRPSLQDHGGGDAMPAVNSVTRRYASLLRADARLRALLRQARARGGAECLEHFDAMDAYEREALPLQAELQYHVDALVDGCAFDRCVPPGTNARAAPKAHERSAMGGMKGKGGRVRGNLMGKRVNFSARTVITPDPNLELGEVALPLEWRATLSYPERLCARNVHELRAAARATDGDDAHGAQRSVTSADGAVTLRIGGSSSIALHEDDDAGVVVERMGRDGDWMMINRQPSLHAQSMMACQVRFLPGRSMRVHPSMCTPFNADFDGDEMNAHAPQGEPARAECKYLAAAERQARHRRSNGVCMGLVQDDKLGAHLYSMRDALFDRAQAMQLLMPLHVRKTILATGGDCFAQPRSMASPLSMRCFDCDGALDFMLPAPAILRPVPRWTGKQLLSLLLDPLLSMEDRECDDAGHQHTEAMPHDSGLCCSSKGWPSPAAICSREGGLCLRGGALLSGTLSRDVTGACKGSVFHVLANVLEARADMDDDERAERLRAQYVRLSRFLRAAMEHSGFSVGVGDIVLHNAHEYTLVDAIVAQVPREVERIVRGTAPLAPQLHTGRTARRPDAELEAREQAVVRVQGRLAARAGAEAARLLRARNPRNAFLLMGAAGSKGNETNIGAVVACVGNRVMRGNVRPCDEDARYELPCAVTSWCGARSAMPRRHVRSARLLPYHAQAARSATRCTLPHFTREYPTAEAGGFVSNSLLKGETPQQFFYDARATRPDLINIAEGTRSAGYLQRKYKCAAETLVVRYDGSVRDCNNRLLQLHYGEDPALCERKRAPPPTRKRRRDSSAPGALLSPALARETERVCDALQQLSRYQEEELCTLNNVARILRSAERDAQHYGVPAGAEETAEAFERALRHIAAGTRRRTAVGLLELRALMDSGAVCDGRRWTREALALACERLESVYARHGEAAPGEPVGVALAHAIGQEMMQLTLSSFHKAGAGGPTGAAECAQIINGTRPRESVVSVALCGEQIEAAAQRDAAAGMQSLRENPSRALRREQCHAYWRILLNGNAARVSIECKQHAEQPAVVCGVLRTVAGAEVVEASLRFALWRCMGELAPVQITVVCAGGDEVNFSVYVRTDAALAAPAWPVAWGGACNEECSAWLRAHLKLVLLPEQSVALVRECAAHYAREVTRVAPEKREDACLAYARYAAVMPLLLRFDSRTLELEDGASIEYAPLPAGVEMARREAGEPALGNFVLKAAASERVYVLYARERLASFVQRALCANTWRFVGRGRQFRVLAHGRRLQVRVVVAEDAEYADDFARTAAEIDTLKRALAALLDDVCVNAHARPLVAASLDTQQRSVRFVGGQAVVTAEPRLRVACNNASPGAKRKGRDIRHNNFAAVLASLSLRGDGSSVSPVAAKSTCNDVHEVRALLGVEAARETLRRELHAMTAGGGVYIDYRHLDLLAELMCSAGVYRSLRYADVAASRNDVFGAACYEQQAGTLLSAALNARRTPISSASAAICMGRLVPYIGSNACSVFVDEAALANAPDAAVVHRVAEAMLTQQHHDAAVASEEPEAKRRACFSSPSRDDHAAALDLVDDGAAAIGDEPPASMLAFSPVRDDTSAAQIFSPVRAGIDENAAWQSPVYSPGGAASPAYSPCSYSPGAASPVYASSPSYSPSSPSYSPSSPSLSTSPSYSPSSPAYSPVHRTQRYSPVVVATAAAAAMDEYDVDEDARNASYAP